MVKRIVLCFLGLWALAYADTLGNFSPIAVGNEWKVRKYAGWTAELDHYYTWTTVTVNITRIDSINDSLFFWITEQMDINSIFANYADNSTDRHVVTQTKMLLLNNVIYKYDNLAGQVFQYDTVSVTQYPCEKQGSPYFRHTRIPDTLLTNLMLYDKPVSMYWFKKYQHSGSDYFTIEQKYLQGYGLVYSLDRRQHDMHIDITEYSLISCTINAHTYPNLVADLQKLPVIEHPNTQQRTFAMASRPGIYLLNGRNLSQTTTHTKEFTIHVKMNSAGAVPYSGVKSINGRCSNAINTK